MILFVGDPGSTPYNNLYVNNEISKQEHNSDVESSTSSSSPTFSDASSTASTASTEDIQYKQDLNEPIEINESTNDAEEVHEDPQSVDSVAVTEESANLPTEPNEVPEEGTETLPEDLEDSVTIEERATVSTDRCWLGKEAPLWIPDSKAMSCLHCDMRFTMIKRRHHCRACGLVRIYAYILQWQFFVFDQ